MFFSWDGCSLGEMRCNTVPYWRGRTMHALSPPFCSIQQTASRLHSVQQLSATWQIRYFARFLGRFILIFPLRYSCRCFFSFLGRSVLVYSAFLRQMNETNQSTINQPSINHLSNKIGIACTAHLTVIMACYTPTCGTVPTFLNDLATYDYYCI